MAITLATIRTSIYTTIYKHLQSGTYAISTDNIHPSFNRLQLLQEDYPQVIINAPKIQMSKLTFGASGMYEVPVSVSIEIAITSNFLSN